MVEADNVDITLLFSGSQYMNLWSFICLLRLNSYGFKLNIHIMLYKTVMKLTTGETCFVQYHCA